MSKSKTFINLSKKALWIKKYLKSIKFHEIDKNISFKKREIFMYYWDRKN